MNLTSEKKNAEQKALENVLSSQWGTIGSGFIKSSEAVAAMCGVKRGLTVFSASAALETALRAFNIGFSDEVLVSSWSDSIDSVVTAAVSAVPVMCDVCPDTLTFSVAAAKKCLTGKTRAVIADLPAGNLCDVAEIADFCRENGLRFILNMGDAYDAVFGGCPAASYADAAVIDMSQGSVIDAGLAGAVVTDSDEMFDLCFAYHNCGRPFGEGCSLSFDSIIGGDLRIAEWQTAIILSRADMVKAESVSRREKYEAVLKAVGDSLVPVAETKNSVSSRTGLLVRYNPSNSAGLSLDDAFCAAEKAGAARCEGYACMHSQPFLKTDYFKKTTGADIENDDSDFSASLSAEKYMALDLR